MIHNNMYILQIKTLCRLFQHKNTFIYKNNYYIYTYFLYKKYLFQPNIPLLVIITYEGWTCQFFGRHPWGDKNTNN